MMGKYVDGIYVSDDTADSGLLKKFESPEQGWSSQSGFRFQRAGYVSKKLPSAIYRFVQTDNGMFFEKQSFPTDIAVSLPGLPSDYILDQMKLFWQKADIYKEHGLIHKRGILMYGSPGCGKTSIVRLLCNEILKMGDDYTRAASFVGEFRSAEPERIILTIQEDIEGYFDGSAGPEQLKSALSFLDGENQTNNIVHLATTNEPEKLADRFIKRPGRFDLVIGMHAPTEETRRAYLRHVDPNLNEDVLEELVQKTEGLSLAYLRELISTYVCLNISLDDTLKRLRFDSKRKSLKNKEDGKMGFTVGYGG
jgi:SpoVK/Ycf46/Vps4 family AAA+-type ATPase